MDYALVGILMAVGILAAIAMVYDAPEPDGIILILLFIGIFTLFAFAMLFSSPIYNTESIATVTLKGYDTGGMGWYVDTDDGRIDTPRDEFHKIRVGDKIVIRHLIMWDGSEHGLSYIGRL